MNRLVATVVLLALGACSQVDHPSSNALNSKNVAHATGASQPHEAFGLAAGSDGALSPYEARIRQAKSFADLPDRGELLSYAESAEQGSNRVVEGAYISSRVRVSEEHALRAIVTGHLSMTTPSGEMLDIRYDKHVEHENGDLTWIGYLDGVQGAETILTFGAEAVYGSIGQSGKRSLQIDTRDGASWMIETDPAKLAGIDNAGAKPDKPDYLAIPKTLASTDNRSLSAVSMDAEKAGAAPGDVRFTTIDLLVGYSPGFSNSRGGTSGALTRINFLVAVSNQALANSKVYAHIRLVGATKVNYTDANGNDVALEAMTGFDSSTQQPTPPDPTFNSLRSARERYGADLVTLIRDFRDPEHDGCGIAWLVGGSKVGITPGDGQDEFAYSVVSDGADNGYYCRVESLVHELGHNMGSAHDRTSARGEDGALNDPDDYGAFDYSFGYKAGAASGNFYTVMAYGDEEQVDYRVFSSRDSTFCGGRVCGTVNDDNSRSLSNLVTQVARFRATRIGKARHDAGGNGYSDLFYRIRSLNSSFACQNMSNPNSCFAPSIGLSWDVVTTGDFNGDQEVDFVWGAAGSPALSLWTGAQYRWFQRYVLPNMPTGWSVVGAGDINGDGRSDLLLRYPRSVANNFSYWIMNGYTRVAAGYDTLGASWRLAASGDFNRDGLLDLVWTADSTRQINIWLGNGTTFSKHAIGTYGLGWSVVGAGDIDGDGKDDLLLRYYKTAANNFSYWIMNGIYRGRVGYASMGASYRLASWGDYNGDSKLDMQWFADSTRGRFVWYGNGTTFAARYFGTVPNSYEPITN